MRVKALNAWVWSNVSSQYALERMIPTHLKSSLRLTIRTACSW
ncbi:MAG: hypothetical protein ACLUDU_00670 [Butyricimonas faecihominis]